MGTIKHASLEGAIVRKKYAKLSRKQVGALKQEKQIKMREYVALYKDNTIVYVMATSFDTNNIIEVAGKEFIPFLSDGQIIGIISPDNLVKISVRDWDVND
jgi:hypothetical protein